MSRLDSWQPQAAHSAQTRYEIFIKGTEPTEYCTEHQRQTGSFSPSREEAYESLRVE